MTIGIRNLEWLDHNSERNYPLTVEATAKDISGEFELPDEFIVSLYLAVNAGVNIDPDRFFISSIGNFASGFGITIGYNAAGGVQTVATANIARSAFSQYTAYRLTGVGNFIDATGVIKLGKIDNIDEQPGGQFTFEFSGSRLETDVIRPQIRGISSLRTLTGSNLSDRLYGDIVLQAGTNMRITVVQISGQDDTIVFDAIEGEGLNEDCVCEDDATIAPCLRTINGIPGTTDGDFTILGNACLIPEAIEFGLRLRDVCSEPCCGCKELEIVTAQLEQFGRQATTLENFLVNIEARVTEMDMVVLGARLGDRGCLSCS